MPAGDAAEVDYEGRCSDHRLVVDVGVGGDDRGDVGASQARLQLDRGEAVAGQLGDEGVVVGDLGAEVLEAADDLQRRRFAGVADAALVADAEDEDAGAVDRLADARSAPARSVPRRSPAAPG